MIKSKVYFIPVDGKNRSRTADISRKLLEKLVSDNPGILPQEIPIKIHTGEPGNETYLKPDNFREIISYFKEKNIKTYFVETNTAAGPRSNEVSHLKIAADHGFTLIPFMVADGPAGFDHQSVQIDRGKHFKSCLIAAKLANASRVLVTSHFKGHIMSGFGGAIKQLALGFASGRGKIDLHSKIAIPDHETINWGAVRSVENGVAGWKTDLVYADWEFRERTVEYALAAVNRKKFMYIQYAVDITENCDCDGHKMDPVYRDLGILASTDPVAIDKACFDLLRDREGKAPFSGEDIFPYAQKLGLGLAEYDLIRIP
jgi:uncharacterized Fe-S center protein